VNTALDQKGNVSSSESSGEAARPEEK